LGYLGQYSCAFAVRSFSAKNWWVDTYGCLTNACSRQSLLSRLVLTHKPRQTGKAPDALAAEANVSHTCEGENRWGRTVRSVLSAVIAYVGSRLLFGVFDFHYRLIGDPFDVGKLVIDLGVFVGFYLIGYWLLGYLKLFKNSSGG
jgi:hypothetical protein